MALAELGKQNIEQWLAQGASHKIKGNWQAKLGGKTCLDQLEAGTVEASAYRLSRDKDRLPLRVAELTTADGTDAKLVPERFRQVLELAESLARK